MNPAEGPGSFFYGRELRASRRGGRERAAFQAWIVIRTAHEQLVVLRNHLLRGRFAERYDANLGQTCPKSLPDPDPHQAGSPHCAGVGQSRIVSVSPSAIATTFLATR
jgi:hypothetical protein